MCLSNKSVFVPQMEIFTKDHPLTSHNSFGVEVFARFFAEFDSGTSLRRIFDVYDPQCGPWYVLGGGNNVVFTRDYPGLVIHPVSKNIERLGTNGDTVHVRADAGVEWDDFVAWCVERGLGGVENLSLIPGHVGAAPVQNIGAYGAEAGDVIVSVELYDVASGEVRTMAGAECGFAYRDSVFKRELRGKVVILSVTFALSVRPDFRLEYGGLRAKVEEKGEPTLESVRRSVIEIRQDKLPDPKVLGNAGSFFKNPVVTPAVAQALQKQWPAVPVYDAPEGMKKLAAGWLIDKAGWKAKIAGRVGMHKDQALVLVNYGGATGSEIMAFAREVQDDVHRKFGVEIEPEVNIL